MTREEEKGKAIAKKRAKEACDSWLQGPECKVACAQVIGQSTEKSKTLHKKRKRTVRTKKKEKELNRVFMSPSSLSLSSSLASCFVSSLPGGVSVFGWGNGTGGGIHGIGQSARRMHRAGESDRSTRNRRNGPVTAASWPATQG